MYTIEASYLTALTFLIILSLIGGALRIHRKIYHFSKKKWRTEYRSHEMGGEKELFRPERFLREHTLRERKESDVFDEQEDP